MLYRAACAALFLASLATTLFPARALAGPTKDQCVDANVRAQNLRRAGALSAAVQELDVCAAAPCPEVVRADCIARLDELMAAQPTIAFEIQDASGVDIPSVVVSLDGKVLTSLREGVAIPVDIGRHEFVFAAPDRAPLTRSIVLVEREKGRRERITLGPSAKDVPPPLVVPAAAGRVRPSPPGLGTGQVVGITGIVLGSAGVVLGGVFGVMAISEKNKQVSACGSADGQCTPVTNYAAGANAHDSASTDGTVSTVGFIAGGALLAGGLALFLTGKPAEEPKPAARLLILPQVGRGTAGLTLAGEF